MAGYLTFISLKRLSIVPSAVVVAVISFSMIASAYGLQELAPKHCFNGKIDSNTCVEDLVTSPNFILIVTVPLALAVAAVIIVKRRRKASRKAQ